MDAQEVEFEVPAVNPPPMAKQTGTYVMTRNEPAPPLAGSPTTQVMGIIERLTFDTSVPIERAQQAFAFWQQVQAEQAKKDFIVAMIACQSEMEPVRKDAANKQTQSRYATYGALDRAIRPTYTKHGFSVTHDTEPSPLADHVRILCHVTHSAGHERTHTADIPCDGKGAKGGDVMTKTHAMGSAMSYGKRYNLGNAFNISTESDDDGNAAGGGRVESWLITESQQAELEALIVKAGVTVARFCKLGKVERLADIRAADFEKGKAVLIAKINGGGAK